MQFWFYQLAQTSLHTGISYFVKSYLISQQSDGSKSQVSCSHSHNMILLLVPVGFIYPDLSEFNESIKEPYDFCSPWHSSAETEQRTIQTENIHNI